MLRGEVLHFSYSSKPSVPCRQYYYSSHCASIPNVLSKKLQQLKLKILQKNLPNRCFMWAGQGKILILEKRIHFFFGPWLLVCQFLENSNQMNINGNVLYFEQCFFVNSVLHKIFIQSFRLRHLPPFDWKFL